MRRIGVPFVLGFFNKFECKLALSCTSEAMQHENALGCVLCVEIGAHLIEDVFSAYERGHRRWTKLTIWDVFNRFNEWSRRHWGNGETISRL